MSDGHVSAAASRAEPDGAMLAAHGLVKQYGGRRALDGFDLTVRAGEITGLIGHNGAGKTTFVEVVTGLVRPDAGRVTVAGVDVRRDPHAARRLLGVAPQEVALYVSATVRDNLRLFAALAGLRGRALRRAVDQVAEELQLTGVLGQRDGPAVRRPAAAHPGGHRAGRRGAAAAARRADGGRRPGDPRRPARRRSAPARPAARPSCTPPTTCPSSPTWAPRWPWPGRAGSSPAATRTP